MFLRGQQVRGVRLFVDLIFCLCGLALLVYAVYLWSGYGFTFGPNHHLHPDAPDPSGPARGLVLIGLVIAGYFGFDLAIMFTSSDSTDKSGETENS